MYRRTPEEIEQNLELEEAAESHHASLDSYRRAKFLLIGILAASLAIALLLMYLIPKSITVPLAEAVNINNRRKIIPRGN